MASLQRSDALSVGGLFLSAKPEYLRDAAFRILEARAQLAIDQRGTLSPQTQQASGAYQRIASGGTPSLPPAFFDSWNFGFNMAWEIDFWGGLRRAITAGEDAPAGLRGELRPGGGHDARRYRGDLRADPHRSRATIRLLNISVKTQQGNLRFHRRPPQGRLQSERVGLGPGQAEPAADPGADSALGDRHAAGFEPPLHVDGHSGDRYLERAGRPAHSHGAAHGGHRHPGRIGSPPARRAASRAFGGGGPNRSASPRGRCIRRSLSTARSAGRRKNFKDLFNSNAPGTAVSAPISNGTCSTTAASRTTFSCRTRPSSNS